MSKAKWMAMSLLMVMVCGCENQLETGYRPRPLGASAADREAYYAPEYSPAAHPQKNDSSPLQLGE